LLKVKNLGKDSIHFKPSKIMETSTKKEPQISKDDVFNQEFIAFLRMYEEDKCSEFLHDALYYLFAEGDPHEHKQEVSHTLYFLRDYLNRLSEKYVPLAPQPLRRNTLSKKLELTT